MFPNPHGRTLPRLPAVRQPPDSLIDACGRRAPLAEPIAASRPISTGVVDGFGERGATTECAHTPGISASHSGANSRFRTRHPTQNSELRTLNSDSPAAETRTDAKPTPRDPRRGCSSVSSTSASRRPGTSALQACARNPEVVCNHPLEGGRPRPPRHEPMRNRRPATPAVAALRCHPPQHLGGRGRPPSRRVRGTRRLCATIRWRAAVPGRRDTNRCETDAPPTRRGGSSVSSTPALGGRGRPPSRRLRGTRRLCATIPLEGGCNAGCAHNPGTLGMLEWWVAVAVSMPSIPVFQYSTIPTPNTLRIGSDTSCLFPLVSSRPYSR